MNKRIGFFLCVAVMLASSARASDWSFAIGATYASGITDVVDQLEQNLEDRGFVVDTLVIPIGIIFQGYTEWDSGIGAGFNVGPAVAALGDISFFDIPVGLDVRYTIITDGRATPYVKAGIRYHIAGGDDIESSDAGPFAGIGVVFGERSDTRWGMELAYDGAEVELIDLRSNTRRQSIKPSAAMLSVFFVF